MSYRGAPFHAFTQPGFQYVKTIGRMGNGPDEFTAPEVFPSDDPQYVCYLTDLYLAKVYGVDKNLNMHFLKQLFDNGGISTYLRNICPSGRDRPVTYQLKKHPLPGPPCPTHCPGRKDTQPADEKPGQHAFHRYPGHQRRTRPHGLLPTNTPR